MVLSACHVPTGCRYVYDLPWCETPQGLVTYGDIFLQNEVEMSTYNFNEANVNELFKQFIL